MPISGNNPGDSRSLLGETIDEMTETEGTSGAGGGGAAGAARIARGPFDVGCPGHTKEAAAARAEVRPRLLGAAKGLLAVAQEALVSGATTAQEIRSMQRLEVWVARLVAEEAGWNPPPGGPGGGGGGRRPRRPNR